MPPRRKPLPSLAGSEECRAHIHGESPTHQPLAAGIIDVDHLARMTFGEKPLQVEVLILFDRQAEMLLSRVQQSPPQAAGAYAHTLAGSARSVGAWAVAAAAQEVELAARASVTMPEAVRRLANAIAQARAVIGALITVD